MDDSEDKVNDTLDRLIKEYIESIERMLISSYFEGTRGLLVGIDTYCKERTRLRYQVVLHTGAFVVFVLGLYLLSGFLPGAVTTTLLIASFLPLLYCVVVLMPEQDELHREFGDRFAREISDWRLELDLPPINRYEYLRKVVVSDAESLKSEVNEIHEKLSARYPDEILEALR